MKKNLSPFRVLCVAITSLTLTLPATAQIDAPAKRVTPPEIPGQATDAEAHTGKSHWRINTDPISRSTTVQFFSNQQQVLYEEVLPGRYIELNDRNVAQLDQLLSRISTNNLVASELKTMLLLPDSQYYKKHASEPATQSVPAATSQWLAGLYANLIYDANRRKLIVRLANPSGNRVNLKLTDEADHELYWNSVVASTVIQCLNMRTTPDGRYTLTIYRPYSKEQYSQKILIRLGVLSLTD